MEGFLKYVGSLDIYAIEQLVSHGVDLTLKNRFDAPATNRFYPKANIFHSIPRQLHIATSRVRTFDGDWAFPVWD